MNILHFSTSDGEGGSARSAHRIHSTLRALGHGSKMLVGIQSGDDPDVGTVHGGGVRRLLDRVADEVGRRSGLQYLWYPSGSRVLEHPWVAAADLIQLYNTHGGYLSHRLLPALAAKAPIVWRLSDMWPLTGHCAYSGTCDGWRTGCQSCPDLATYPAIPFDTAHLLWGIKRKILAAARPTIVVPSRWLGQIARVSPAFAGLRILHIANGIDRTIFHPIDRAAARSVLGLPADRQMVLYCAQVATDSTRKGSADFVEACHRLAAETDFDVVVAGHGGESLKAQIPQRVHVLGFIRDVRLLAATYSAADVMLAPSTVENLPNTILEAMACGTAVVAYKSGGIEDAVVHGESGWLAGSGNRIELTQGTAAVLSDTNLRDRLAHGALQRIAIEFDAAGEAGSFLTLYQELLEEHGGRQRKSA